ncbi:MAG: hypothetical protein HQ592_02105 [Planctomycetes bacterium]|nr:hypothetical protein [Planctomycetota bacterium]
MQKNGNQLRWVTLAIVIAALVTVALIMARRPGRSEDFPDIYLKDGRIVVSMRGARLADIDRAINDPNVFRYDENEHRAQASAHLLITGKGSLAIGSEEQGETLEFDTNVCGDASLGIDPDASLTVMNSEILTTHRTITSGLCTRGYTVRCEGTLTARNSKFLYISGNKSQFFSQGTATGMLDNVVIALSDGASLRLVRVDGSRLAIRNSRFETDGKYGLYILGNTKKPVRIENSSLHGTTADVFLAWRSGELVLVDCIFQKDHVRFENSTGSIRVKWRAHVKVEKNGKPVPGVAVVVEDDGRTLTAPTDENGLALLEVTEQIIRDGSVTMVTPHVFRVTADGAALIHSEPVNVTDAVESLGEIKLTIE